MANDTFVASRLPSPCYSSLFATNPSSMRPGSIITHEAPSTRFLTLTSLPTMSTPSPPSTPTPTLRTPSLFLRLPVEIRLQIYSLLVLPRKASDLIPSLEKLDHSANDYYNYDKHHTSTTRPFADAHPPLLIRTLEGQSYAKQSKLRSNPHKRTQYWVRDRFRNRCQPTTYQCINVPRLEDQVGILGTCRQTHAEAAEVLYGHYTFDFDTHVEAVVPFLHDLTPFARSRIRSIRLVKRALAYDKEFDRAEWSAALRYLTSSSSGMNIRRLELGIVAGRPGPNGWDRISTYSAQDFELLRELPGMEWMQYLLEMKDLAELEVEAVVEHCPPATNSMAMGSFIRFSASIEGGFAEFLKRKLLE